MRSTTRSYLLGCSAVLVWTGAALGDPPVTFLSATPGKPVIAEKWSDVPKLHPKGYSENGWGQWIGKPCFESGLVPYAPVEFHRQSGGSVVAIVPCLGIGDELWVHVRRNFEIVPLPMPSAWPDGGFALRRNTGHFVWAADSSTFTVTTSSDAISYMAQRITYAVGSSVKTIRLLKVESALYFGPNQGYSEWQTEWEAKPWRAQPKGPLVNQ